LHTSSITVFSRYENFCPGGAPGYRVALNLDHGTETHDQNSVVFKLNNVRFLQVMEFCCPRISNFELNITEKITQFDNNRSDLLYCSIMTHKSRKMGHVSNVPNSLVVLNIENLM